VTQGTSKPGFAHAGRPAQNQIVVRVDPLAIGELLEQSAVEAAWGSVIDVFASVICWAIHSAVGFAVTSVQIVSSPIAATSG
jgi:hypothetical protein